MSSPRRPSSLLDGWAQAETWTSSARSDFSQPLGPLDPRAANGSHGSAGSGRHRNGVDGRRLPATGGGACGGHRNGRRRAPPARSLHLTTSTSDRTRGGRTTRWAGAWTAGGSPAPSAGPRLRPGWACA